MVCAVERQVKDFIALHPEWQLSDRNPSYLVLTRTYYSQIPGPVWIVGHTGLLGQQLTQQCLDLGLSLLLVSHSHLDLLDAAAVDAFVEQAQPRTVIMAAARIGCSQVHHLAYDFLTTNLRMQENVLNACNKYGTDRLLLVSSTHVYAESTPMPMEETQVFAGTNAFQLTPYVLAKLMGLKLFEACVRQYGHRGWAAVILPNLYGPSSHFATDAYAIPYMMRKLHTAKTVNCDTLILNAIPTHICQFMHVRDAATGCLKLLQSISVQMVAAERLRNTEYISNPSNHGAVILNLCGDAAEAVTIEHLALTIQKVVGYTGTITWGEFKSHHPIAGECILCNKLLTTALEGGAWTPQVDLTRGLTQLYEWYSKNAASSGPQGQDPSDS